MIDPSINVACQAFLKVMMQESMRRYPTRAPHEHTVPQWDTLSVNDRMTLQRSMAAGLAAARSVRAGEVVA